MFRRINQSQYTEPIYLIDTGQNNLHMIISSQEDHGL